MTQRRENLVHGSTGILAEQTDSLTEHFAILDLGINSKKKSVRGF